RVVVRAGLLVIEVAAEDDLPGGGVGPRDRRHQRLIWHRVVVARADDGVKSNRLTAAQPLLQRPRLAQRNHDGEGVPPPARVEMAAANLILLVSPPAGDL